MCYVIVLCYHMYLISPGLMKKTLGIDLESEWILFFCLVETQN